MKFKSRKISNKILFVNLVITIFVCLVVYLFNLPWNSLDYELTDQLYAHVVKEGKGPKVSRRIIILSIDDSTYQYFGKNYLDREDLAKVNNILATLSPTAVFYDIIFPRSSTGKADSDFAISIEKLGNVFLPVGLRMSAKKKKFLVGNGTFYKDLTSRNYGNIKELNNGEPYYAVSALPQMNLFTRVAAGTGNISIVKDNDGILRHIPLVVKIDSLFFPAASLQMYLDYDQIPFDSIKIKWGSYIEIPPLKGSYLTQEIRIPIDKKGMTFIPFPSFWNDGKMKMMEVQKLVKYSKNDLLYDDLLNYFEGNFVFVSDISIGSSDLGETTLEGNVPLVSMHTAVLNALLNDSFYKEWKDFPLVLIIFLLGMVLGVSALTKSNSSLYITAIIIIIGLTYFSYYEVIHYSLFPLATAGISVIVITVGLLLALNVLITKDQAFIRSAFSKYVPDNVINELIEKPDMLKLGGEERVLTILFSDIEGFTTISESMPSTALVPLLNEYLNEMTEIIIKNDGTIDKFIGDAILAEFGAPIRIAKHFDSAVYSAIKMHKRLNELNKTWAANKLPLIRARIGINTGKVIVGNMGSDRVFDYTVIGDSVNLASRLEGANKIYGTSILLSESTYKDIDKGKFNTRLLDIVKVKGKTKAVKIYEVYGYNDDKISYADKSYYELYEQGFKLYLEKDFTNAKTNLQKSLAYRADDKPVHLILERIEQFENAILEENWDGSLVLHEK